MPNLTGKAANQVVTHGDLGPLAYYSAEMLSAAVVEQVLVVRDEKTSGTGGGASSATTWNARSLNTTAANTIASASLSGGNAVLPAGTYDLTGWAIAGYGGKHKMRLYNVTAGATLLVGASASSASSTTSLATLNGRFTLAASSTLRLDHYTSAADSTDGLGSAVGASGVSEVYAHLEFRKVA